MRDRHRQTPGRIGIPEQNVGDGAAALHAGIPGQQYCGDLAVPGVEHDGSPADHHNDGSGIGGGHRHDERDVIGVQSKITPVTAELLLFRHPGGHFDQCRRERPESGDAAEQLCRLDVHPDQ